MPTHHASPTRKGPPPIQDAQDAISLLEAEHQAVALLFKEYERTRSAASKKALIAEICKALSVRVQIEEEIFYPAVKTLRKTKPRVCEAGAEHAVIKSLIARLEDASHDLDAFDAQVRILSEHLTHHGNEKQTQIYTRVQSSSLDLLDLGTRMAARKEDLMAQFN